MLIEEVTKSENYEELLSKEETLDKKKIPKESGEISRREFIKDAGLVVGGAAIGSTVLLAACGEGEVTTETVTKTATVTETAAEVTKTKTVTETVSTFVCPSCGGDFNTLAELKDHVEAEHPGEVVQRAKFALHHDPLLCGGCSTCHDVCEFVHDGAAGLRVIQHPLQGYVTELETCQQCPIAWCMEACLFDAISIHPGTGARVIDATKCTACGECTEACPLRMPAPVPSKDTYFKCDLCDGAPKCVEYCPWGGLTLVKVEEV